MTSADFCLSIPMSHNISSCSQICRSPQVMRTHLHAYVCRIYAHRLPYRYWISRILAPLSRVRAFYAVSVRQTSALPAASFRFHLAMDTLAVRLTLAPVGCVKNFHLQVGAPSRAHQKKDRWEEVPPVSNLEKLLSSRRTQDRRDRCSFLFCSYLQYCRSGNSREQPGSRRLEAYM